MLRAAEFASVMIVPLITGGRVLGALTLASWQAGRRYGEDDLGTAEELARRAATAIENARLYKSRSDIARTLQQSLLPPVLPSLPGCQVAGRYRAAGEDNEVGGDFYDLFELAQECWALAIGDVCGKGAQAAAVTGLARYTLRAAAMRESAPSRMLAVLNDALLSQRGQEELCTVALAVVRPTDEGMHLTLANAGHPRPLVARAGGSVEAVGVHGTALGVSGELSLEDCSVELGPGDTIAFYTDGVMDAHAPAVILGEEELATFLAGCRGEGPSACAERLERAVLGSGTGEPRDDMAMLVLRVELAGDPASPLGAPLKVRLPGGPAAPGAARRELEALTDHVDADTLRDAQLLLSELVTNSVVHGGAGERDTIEVTISTSPEALRIEVRDDGPGHDRVPSAPALDDLSGRGLFLVEQVADRHGYSHGGTRVWFELEGG